MKKTYSVTALNQQNGCQEVWYQGLAYYKARFMSEELSKNGAKNVRLVVSVKNPLR